MRAISVRYISAPATPAQVTLEPAQRKPSTPISDQLRQIAAQAHDEPEHVLIERMARLLAAHFDGRGGGP